ncbi:low-specificity L-threonine aldolase 2, partial [Asbolus verrucosus]
MYEKINGEINSSSVHVVDLRSDTISKPTPEMREAMANAAVGDDVFGEDPTVIELERRSAEILGKEDAVFVASGTMANLIAIMVHCSQRGSEIISGDNGHTFRFEQGGPAQIAGVQTSLIKNNDDGTFSLDELRDHIRKNPDVHEPYTSLVIIENTHNMCGGKVLPLDWIEKVKNISKEYNIPVHMDGARVMNAAVHLKVPVERVVRDVDTVCFCLSKGLGAPIGSILAGNKNFVDKARRTRKVLGGGWRQAGIIAAAGLVALDKMIDRLQEDHDHIMQIARAIDKMKSSTFRVDLSTVQSNILMMYLDVSRITAKEVQYRLATVLESDTVKVSVKTSSRDGEQKTITDIGPSKSLTDTPLHIISSRGELIKLLQTLKSMKEISLDIQLHSREFQGCIALLAISTREADYVIDAMKLKNELLLLTEIFINPKIVKIIFKSEIVLSNLQQYLHLFVVNVFDVNKAGLALHAGKHGTLYTILRHDFGYVRDLKLHQADFRTRPLSEYMKNYCRNRKTMMLQSMEEDLKKRHNCQLDVLQKLFLWRHNLARKNNKNPEAIIGNSALINLAGNLPTFEKVVLAFSNSQFVKKDESLENHPYKQVLTNFEPNAEQLSVSDVELPKSLQQTPLHEINKIDDLEKLVNDLKQEKEIGVDVEWSDHGYKAVTCLLQVSTKNDDYIIDAIDLKDHMLLLNEVFTNPGIVKIFHAATNDLKWLQQDFDLFIINMFDSQRAMKALGYPKLGLEVLLQNYAVVKDKSMQRVDFRKRPLPPKYKDYARTDSHFLIHIYHNLKNELIQANLLGQVLSECNNDCKVVYEKVTDVSYQSIRDEIVKMHQRQLLALEKLNKWRHSVAEYVDINTGHVLSKANMKALVLQMPTDPATIVRICKSDYVKQHLQEVVKVMVEARGQKPQGFTQSESFGQKFGRKRKLDETTFSGDDRGGRRSFYHDDGNRSRKKEFDLRNTLGR